MADAHRDRAANEYWGRDGLGQAILDALVASGKDLDALTVDDLAPLDHFHGGGKAATERLARLADFPPDTHVLDVGGGVGGPARTLVAQFGCRVTLVDPTESYVAAGALLTERMGLAGRLAHRIGSGLDLPFADGTFDAVWTQNSGMNIADKERLYAEFYRVLRPGGRLAIQEPMAGPVQPILFPVMWARDASTSFLRSPAEMRAIIVAAGFRARAWDDVTAETTPTSGSAPAHTIQKLVMGDWLTAMSEPGRRNADERRLVLVQAVFDRL
ncbi:MAG TPA: methyltransferase domain-containing protein [Chloroflexota bacterium]|nr:methyltransferase domain-containing protein [Chloroflexota bacterium]